jgi:hypothetical protein
LINKDLELLSEWKVSWQEEKMEFSPQIAESNPQFFPQKGCREERFIMVGQAACSVAPQQT